MISSKVMPGCRQQITSAASPIHDLLISSSYQLFRKVSSGIWDKIKPLFKSDSVFFLLWTREAWYTWHFIKECGTWCPQHSWATCIAVVLTMDTRVGISSHFTQSSVKYYRFNSSGMACMSLTYWTQRW